jgi:hypothetical protein
MLRIDYEVSSAFHCTDSTCNSYKNAYNHVAQLIRSQTSTNNVAFIYHPVRGEYQQLYPGDANVDWIGVSIFNHELCMPIYDINQYYYNGTPGTGFDTTNNLCKGYVLTRDSNGNLNATPQNFQYDFNVLSMLKFAQDHSKPMIFSENAPMNFSPGQNANGTEPDSLVTTWVNRVFGLLNYKGPLPNMEGTYDLSNVVKAVVYINLDLRYGFDGYYGQSSYQFPYDADWYNNAQLTAYNQAKTAFCNGLSSNGFLTQCGTGTTTTTPVATTTTVPPTTTPSGGGSLPSPWLDSDVGSVGTAGSASYTSGTFSVKGAGADIQNTADAFNFVSESITGDGSIVAKLASEQNTDPSAKAGVMIRNSLNANASYVSVLVTPGNGISLQWRTQDGQSTGYQTTAGSAPKWLKVVRSGNSFSGYYSSDGSTWSQIGPTINTVMNNTSYKGLVASSHNSATLNLSTFSNVS